MATFDHTATDSMTFADAPSSEMEFSVTATDGATLADSPSSQVQFATTATDSMNLSDSGASMMTFMNTVLDALNLNDIVIAILKRDNPYEEVIPSNFDAIDLWKAVHSPASQGVKKLSLERIVGELVRLIVEAEQSFRLVGGDVTITLQDKIVYVDASLGNNTVTLPDPATARGRAFTIKRSDNSGSTTSFSHLIDGSAQTLSGLGSMVIQSDGSTYRKIG